MSARRSVALWDVRGILRLGLAEVLAETGVAVVRDVSHADAVLIDLDRPGCAAEASRLLTHRPGLLVVACSADRPAMRAFTAAGPTEERRLTAAALRATLAAPLAPAPPGNPRRLAARDEPVRRDP